MRGVYYREASNTNVKAHQVFMRQAGTQPLFGKFYRINRLFKFKIYENIGIFCQNIDSL